MEYSCRTGRCGICAAPLADGETDILRPEESLGAEEAAGGVILTCCRAAVSDVSLGVEDLGRLAGLETRVLPCRIDDVAVVSPDIAMVVLKTPPTARLDFVAGQYIDVIAGGVRRSYSISNAIRDLIERQGAVPNIPSKANRPWKSCFSKTLYKGRNAVDKLAANFLGAIYLAAAVTWWL